VNTRLLEALAETAQQNRARFHFPSHAGQPPFEAASVLQTHLYDYDQTELPHLDILGDPSGVLAASQKEVAVLYGARESFYLINGASTGIMAALLALATIYPEASVLMARNAHRSAVDGLVLSGLHPCWVQPEYLESWGVWGEITLTALKNAYEQAPEAKAVLITHPTYEGISSDMAAIAEWCQQNGLCLIVDEAHGALWPLSEGLPDSALSTGADCVVHSLHKSGGCLTQGALLHLSKTSLLSARSIQAALNILQTTSPSYVLLGSLEATCSFWASSEGQDYLHHHILAISEFRQWATSVLKTIRIYPHHPGQFQLVFQHPKLSPEAFADALETKYGVAFEALSGNVILCSGNIGLKEADWRRLKDALSALDETMEAAPCFVNAVGVPHIIMACSPREAYLRAACDVPIEEAIGKISQELIATCPPGIAILMPGERIQSEHLVFIKDRQTLSVLL
jgi:arginine decarboxylase